MQTIDKLIGVDDLKLGKDSYFTSNLFESLIKKEIYSMIQDRDVDIKDLLNISLGGKFGEEKDWGAQFDAGPSYKYFDEEIPPLKEDFKFNLFKEF